MLHNREPLLSIGMPVFNSEKYLKNTLDAILAQTFQDFELIISDNASTDRTQEICQEYATKDKRIHYYRNEKNLGAPKNYNRVFELSSGKYFKWAAYDDLFAPEFLRKCIEVLDNDPSIVLCHSKSGRINQDGDLVGYYNQGIMKKIDSPKPHERFGDLIKLYYTTCPVFGVFRTELLAKTPLQGSYIGADRNLLAEIGLMGRIHQIPECLFFWRDHPASYTSMFYGSNRTATLELFRNETAWWSNMNVTDFPYWKNCIEYFRSINRVPLKWSERLRCYAQLFRWVMEEGRRFLFTDIEIFLLHNSRLARKLIPFVSLNLRRTVFSLFKK
jgi:glycosyltransferase involved in cell wall biosynthesis